VYALHYGKAVITAKAGEASASCIVYVSSYGDPDDSDGSDGSDEDFDEEAGSAGVP